MEEETDINELLTQLNKLHDDETFSKLIFSLQTRGQLYHDKKSEIDKDKLLDGIDTILVESRQDD